MVNETANAFPIDPVPSNIVPSQEKFDLDDPKNVYLKRIILISKFRSY